LANHLMQFFSYEHLPPLLQDASAPLCRLARQLDTLLPETAEKTAGLRKLLEAKDCFVRAAIEAATLARPASSPE
jgi:hypothetical protein